MTGRKKSFKKRVVARWALSYLLIALVPLAAVLSLAVISLRLNSSAMTKSNEVAVAYVQQSFENVFNEVNSIKTELLMDSDFMVVRNAASSNEFTSVYLNDRKTDLRHLELSNSSLKGIILFSPLIDWFITGGDWGNVSSMAKSSLYLALPQDRINSMMLKEIRDVHMYELPNERLLVIVPLHYAKSSNVNDMCVGVIVDRSTLLPSNFGDYNDVVVYSDSADRVVYDFSGFYETGSYDPLLASITFGESRTEGDTIASVSANSIMRLKFIVLVDKAVYFRNYYVLFRIIGVILAVALVVGTISAAHLVKRSWSRLSRAAKDSGVDIESVPSDAGQYAPFVSSVSSLKAQKVELSNALFESTIEKIVNGDSSVNEETLASMDMKLVSDAFYVIIPDVGDEDGIKLVSELDEGSLVIPFKSSYGDAFIVNTLDANVRHVESVLTRAQGRVESMSISTLHHGLASIRECYVEAINVHEYQKDHGIPFMSYSELESIASQSSYHFSLEDTLALQKAIREGDNDAAKGVVNRSLALNRENDVSPRMMRFLLYTIAGTIIRTLNSLDERFSEAVPEVEFPLILQSENFQKSLEGVMEIIDSVCYAIAAVQNQFQDSSAETYALYKKTLEYVKDNYSNGMMNVSSVADNFDISIAYLSRIFKKYHGMNISEYITKYRLDRAKELLVEGRMVGDVAQECGFGSLRTFLRVFKTVEGVTPGQYKSAAGK